MKTKPNSSCGFFLLGNLVGTGERLIVASGQQTFTVIPPESGTIYMSARCLPGDLREGDSVRVSLMKRGTGNPQTLYAAKLINIYRQDSGEAVSGEDPEGETGSQAVAGHQKRSHSQAPRVSTADRRKASQAQRDFRVGQRLLDRGERQAALEYFEKARKTDPNEALAKQIADALKEAPKQGAAFKKTPR